MASIRVIVVGAGCFGVAAAVELARRGHHVVVLDPGPVPHPDAASTDISKIVRMDYGDDPFYTRLARRALAGWDAWNRTRRLYHETGFLLLTRSPTRPGGFEHESRRVLAEHGHRVEPVDAGLVATRYPAWHAERIADGYYNPRAGWAESGNAVAWLARRARAAGVTFRAVRVDRLLDQGGRVRGVVTADAGTIDADRVVVAAGAWTPTLVPGLADVMWATGQPVLHFRPRNVKPYVAVRFPVWAMDIARTGWYGFPAQRDGTLKIANHGRGVRIDARAGRRVDPAWEDRARAFFAEHLPGLVDAPLQATRLCLYCDTWDGDFWIDRHPARAGLVVAAGGSGHGFKFMPVLGPMIADAVEGVENPWLERFRWRERGESRTEHARSSAG